MIGRGSVITLQSLFTTISTNAKPPGGPIFVKCRMEPGNCQLWLAWSILKEAPHISIRRKDIFYACTNEQNYFLN